MFGHERGSFTGATERRPGKFELASGGTIFLDEIGELPLNVQGKLLRAIEEKVVDRIGGRAPVPVDVRVVAATNRDLQTAAEAGEFRRDLYFRLAVFPIRVPPLRERGDDVVLLAKHFAAQLGRELRKREATLSDEALAALRAHDWPGNVRELENAIERACILADSAVLTPADLGLANGRPPRRRRGRGGRGLRPLGDARRGVRARRASGRAPQDSRRAPRARRQQDARGRGAGRQLQDAPDED